MVERLQSIRLPDAQEVEVVLVRLADGRVVARTPAELEELEGANPQHKEGSP